MANLEKIKWDSIVVTLVDNKLRTSVPCNILPIDHNLNTEVHRVYNVLERRSPEEFKIYIRELFNNRSPSFDDHWYFSKLRRNRS